MKLSQARFFKVAVAISSLLIVFCAFQSPRTPIKFDQSQARLLKTTITLLPIIDRRIEKSAPLDCSGYLKEQVQKKLKDRSYSVDTTSYFFEDTESMDVEKVAKMNIDDYYLLGPSNRDVILLIFVEDFFQKHSLFKFQTKAETTGIIFSKREKVVIWHDKGIGFISEGGVLGALQGALLYKDLSISEALKDLFITLP